MANENSLVIVSGRSGSGKSSALHALEDMEYYCVDNLPTKLIPDLIEEFWPQTPEHDKSLIIVDKLAIGIDARSLHLNDATFRDLQHKLAQYDQLDLQIIYLDADDDTLLRRFSETRRKHPITSETTSLQEALHLEKSLLNPLINDSTIVIDTSSMSLHQLRAEMGNIVKGSASQMNLLFQSFGFKYGIPKDSDLIFDVRCLLNPHWVPHLHPLTGMDNQVAEFLLEDEKVQNMLTTISDYLHRWLPEYQVNNRHYLTVSIGCTGGQHRSVFLAEQLQNIFKSQWRTQVRHRQINSWPTVD